MAPHVGDRWRLARLTVNYRTPAEIMAATADVLAAIDPAQEPPRSVRETGVRPWRRAVAPGALPATLADLTAREAHALREGRLAVIVPESRVAELGAAVWRTVPHASCGADADLTSAVVVLGVGQAKGLEFDVVLIADPAAILAESPRGRNDLYVAMTRSTRRLGVLHTDPVPPEITALTSREEWPGAEDPVAGR